MVSNPRFPHVCVIYRDTTNAYESGEFEYLYGTHDCMLPCRKESSTSKRTYKTNEVIRSDYRLSVPGQVAGILAGDLIDVTDLSGSFKRCIVSESYVTNLGTSIYFNIQKS